MGQTTSVRYLPLGEELGLQGLLAMVAETMETAVATVVVVIAEVVVVELKVSF
jgi:hypothetical protein